MNSVSDNPFPKRLGDFEIIRQIGRGGMGVVYEARQRSLNRRVALKALSSGLGLTAKAVMRFRHEAEAAAKHLLILEPEFSIRDWFKRSGTGWSEKMVQGLRAAGLPE